MSEQQRIIFVKQKSTEVIFGLQMLGYGLPYGINEVDKKEEEDTFNDEKEQIPYELEEGNYRGKKSKYPLKYKDVIPHYHFFKEKIDFADALFLALKKKEISEEKLLEFAKSEGFAEDIKNIQNETDKKDLLDMQEFEYYKYLYNFYLKTPLENLILVKKNWRKEPKGVKKALDKFHDALLNTNEFDCSFGSGLSPIVSCDINSLYFSTIKSESTLEMLKIRKIFASSGCKVLHSCSNGINISFVDHVDVKIPSPKRTSVQGDTKTDQDEKNCIPHLEDFPQPLNLSKYKKTYKPYECLASALYTFYTEKIDFCDAFLLALKKKGVLKERLTEFANAEGVFEEAKSIRDITDKKTLFEMQESEYYKYIYNFHIKKHLENFISAVKANWSRSYGRNIYDTRERFRLACFDTKEFTEHAEMHLDHPKKCINFTVVNRMNTDDIRKLHHIFKHSGYTVIECDSRKLILKIN